MALVWDVCVHLEKVKLHSALHVDGFVFSAAHLLALEAGVFKDRPDAPHTTQIGEIIHLYTNQTRCTMYLVSFLSYQMVHQTTYKYTHILRFDHTFKVAALLSRYGMSKF